MLGAPPQRITPTVVLVPIPSSAIGVHVFTNHPDPPTPTGPDIAREATRSCEPPIRITHTIDPVEAAPRPTRPIDRRTRFRLFVEDAVEGARSLLNYWPLRIPLVHLRHERGGVGGGDEGEGPQLSSASPAVRVEESEGGVAASTTPATN